MIDRARAQINNAYSYRNFPVGAVALAVGDDPSVGIFFSAPNVKKSVHANKVCAEKRLVRSAERAGVRAIVGIVVAGTTDQEKIAEVTPFKTPTLYCCEECVETLDGSYAASDDTLITTVGIEKDIYEVQRFGSLRLSYATRSLVPPQPIRYRPEEWHMREALYADAMIAEQSHDHATRRDHDRSQLAMYALAATLLDQ
ncbi:MAG: hypothetical protein JWM37_312 [Candidatus Saccharibacteria bacterium]|nr:hypothetical protein [Candidatus Saccharibacteria bacterium]